ncbi:MAG: hypothetical protein M1337_01875, partial [Actinobacteria bacterium]|nr:hypothetical protein [Actinomycetota bacterium]
MRLIRFLGVAPIMVLLVTGCAEGKLAVTTLSAPSSAATSASTTTAPTTTVPSTNSPPTTAPPLTVLELPGLSIADVADVTLALGRQGGAGGSKPLDSPS